MPRANRGLGRGTAEALAERGDRVIFVARKRDSLKEIVGNLLKKDLDVAAEECDVSQSTKLPAFCQHILKDYGRIVNVSSGMGQLGDMNAGYGATRSLKEGIFGILWAANLENDGPSGGFFRDGKSIPW